MDKSKFLVEDDEKICGTFKGTKESKVAAHKELLTQLTLKKIKSKVKI